MKQKRGILYWLRVILAAASVIFLCYRCSEGWGIKASAESVTLTPEQTVALYGTDISGTFRRQGDASGTIDFHYAFPLKSVGNQAEGGGFGGIILNAPASYTSEIGQLNGCVYVAQESDWGGGSFPTWRTVSSTQNPADCNFNLQLSVDLGQYTDITQNIAWSTGTWSYVNEYYDYGESFPYYYGCPWECYHDNGPFQGTTLIGRGYAMQGNPNYNWIASGLLTLYPWDGSSPVAENDQCTFAFSRIFMNNQTTGLTVNRMVFGMQTLQQVHKSAQFSPPTGDIWLIIFCPKISDHVPATTTTAVTTRPPATTPHAVPQTYPVATMDSNVTGPLVVINDNSITQINQLNLIIGQLNLIYAQLVANGKLAVDLNWDPDLQDGDSISIYGTDIKHQMETIINGHTTALLPNFNNEYVSSGFGFLMDQPWIAMLGGLGLALSVACWIIFEGRH